MAARTLTIGVVSDTHLPRFGTALPRALRDGLRRHHVDLIVHCGDMTQPVAVELLEAIAPLEGVAGNNDAPDVVRRFGDKNILQVGSLRIGVTHGHEGRGSSTPARARNAFAGERVDAILFGHSHIPHCAWRDDVLLFNPGSPTDKRRQPEYSYGILRVTQNRIEPQLAYYPDKSP